MRSIVIIESPFAGDVKANKKYARECMRDSIARGEAPFLSHLLYPQVLDDKNPTEREMGLECAMPFYHIASAVIVYVDRGVSAGMKLGMERARHYHTTIIERSIKI